MTSDIASEIQKKLRTSYHELGAAAAYAKNLDVAIEDGTATQKDIDTYLIEILRKTNSVVERILSIKQTGDA